MSPIMTTIVLLLAISCHGNSALVEETSENRHAKFFHMSVENPTVAKTNARSRSNIECGHQCLVISGCTGFSFATRTGCTFYSSVMTAAGNGAPSLTNVHARNQAARCLENDRFEIVELDGLEYCVRIFDDLPLPGIQAQRECQSLGANVIALETRRKIDDFRDILIQRHVLWDAYWVGLYDTHVEGKFVWAKNGVRADGANVWDSGQPNGLINQGDQDCVLFKHTYFHDRECSGYYPFACEIDLSI